MKKAEIIKILRKKISENYPQPIVRKAIPDIIEALFSSIKDELDKGEDIKIAGFGTFKIREVKKEETKETKKIIRFVPAKK